MRRKLLTYLLLLTTSLPFASFGIAVDLGGMTNEKGFKGLWIFGGITGAHDLSQSTVNYDYTNLYSGSLNPPGFEVSNTYSLSSSENKLMPTLGLLYVVRGKSLLYGFRLSADRIAGRTLSSDVFDYPMPTGLPETPNGFSMSTEINPTYDFSFSFEPGIQTSNSSMSYLKLSYHQMLTNLSTHTSIKSGLTNPSFNEAGSSERFTGLGAGLGTRFLFSKSFSIDLLLDYVAFLSKKIPASSIASPANEVTITQTQTISPHWVSLSITVGYRL